MNFCPQVIRWRTVCEFSKFFGLNNWLQNNSQGSHEKKHISADDQLIIRRTYSSRHKEFRVQIIAIRQSKTRENRNNIQGTHETFFIRNCWLSGQILTALENEFACMIDLNSFQQASALISTFGDEPLEIEPIVETCKNNTIIFNQRIQFKIYKKEECSHLFGY